MSTNTVSYAPATFIETREIIERTPASSEQGGDWPQWGREFEQIDPPVSASGSSNSNTGSAGSSLNRGLMSALLPILAALIAWMSDAMSSDGSGGGSGGSTGGTRGGGVQNASDSSGGPAGSNAKPVKGNNAATVADAVKGDSADSLVASQKVPMDHGISDHTDCANFASGCLEAAGEIPKSQHTDSVATLKDELLHKDGWHEESRSQVKKGDICIVGGDEHVEIVDSVKDGKVNLVGSNNTLPDGAQAVGPDSYTGNQGNVEFLSS